MNMKDYEKRAEELTREAKQLESTMLTYKALAYCTEHGHDWGGYLALSDDGTFVDGICQRCGVRLTATNVELRFDEANTEGFGELAGKTIEEIAITPPPKTSETADKPTLPLEQTNQSDGTYRVDVSEILGQKGEE